MSYLENVIKASGGYGAPAEVLIEDTNKESVAKYFSNLPRLIQDSLKTAIIGREDQYSEEYLEISDLIPTQETVDSENFKDASEFNKPIVVYRDETGMYLVDGHHRCASKVIAGSTGIRAKVYKSLPLVASTGDIDTLSTETEAALDKGKDDPCWSGYVQLGMKKTKSGKMVPNCVPAGVAQSLQKVQNVMDSDDLVELVAVYNSYVGPSRLVPLSAAATVAVRSYEAYTDSCAGQELRDAVLWETHSFMEYATLGETEDVDIMSEHLDLLPAGHPSLGLTASAADRVNWVSGAPEVDESSREAVKVLLSKSSDSVEHLHASTRVRALISSGSISQKTAALVQSILNNNLSD